MYVCVCMCVCVSVQPSAGDEVFVHYVGTLASDGSKPAPVGMLFKPCKTRTLQFKKWPNSCDHPSTK